MYKGASRNLQRSHRVIEVRPSAAAYITPDDLVPELSGLDLRQCLEERDQLLHTHTRLMNEIQAAKNTRNHRERERLGQQFAHSSTRLGQLKQRIAELRRERSDDAFLTAVREIVPPEMLQAIYARQQELRDGESHAEG